MQEVDVLQEFADFILQLRKERKLSLRDVGEASGLSYTYIGNLERGKDPRTRTPIRPSTDTIRRLSEAFNYPYELLLKKAGFLDPQETGKNQFELSNLHLLDSSVTLDGILLNEKEIKVIVEVIRALRKCD
ncbi:helix-turn-helix domain-containing protein [Paenibacillus sp. yr247]|uniref:helix-turn-helix domain-containing protein n=1 Tax=Paenibacillus sp. yr247 TaxID=1761880 RepID=UPI0015876A7D|nr:helix-turn-helix transcriptional regulator [Paenibacillus sp. yr247]